FENRNTAQLYARIFLTKKRAFTGQNLASWVKTKITSSRKGALTRFYKRRALFFAFATKKDEQLFSYSSSKSSSSSICFLTSFCISLLINFFSVSRYFC